MLPVCACYQYVHATSAHATTREWVKNCAVLGCLCDAELQTHMTAGMAPPPAPPPPTLRTDDMMPVSRCPPPSHPPLMSVGMMDD